MNTLMISEKDYSSLIDLIKAERLYKSTTEDLLSNLAEELKKAEKVELSKLPNDVVKMHSKITLEDLKHKNIFEVSLVYPHEADIKQKKISVLAPIGTALIGYKENDVVEWKIPSGIGRYKIKKVS